MSNTLIIKCGFDLAIAYVATVAVVFAFLVISAYFASRANPQEAQEMRDGVERITGKRVNNITEVLNSISVWIFLYMALIWPKTVVRLIIKINK